MTDPFRAAARRERFTQVVWLVVSLAFLCLLLFAWSRANLTDGREVTALVIKVGTYPDPLGTGDSPLLTVRLSDGSIRQLPSSWEKASGCVTGSRVSLVERGIALKVGLLGCSASR